MFVECAHVNLIVEVDLLSFGPKCRLYLGSHVSLAPFQKYDIVGFVQHCRELGERFNLTEVLRRHPNVID